MTRWFIKRKGSDEEEDVTEMMENPQPYPEIAADAAWQGPVPLQRPFLRDGDELIRREEGDR